MHEKKKSTSQTADLDGSRGEGMEGKRTGRLVVVIYPQKQITTAAGATRTVDWLPRGEGTQGKGGGGGRETDGLQSRQAPAPHRTSVAPPRHRSAGVCIAAITGGSAAAPHLRAAPAPATAAAAAPHKAQSTCRLCAVAKARRPLHAGGNTRALLQLPAVPTKPVTGP